MGSVNRCLPNITLCVQEWGLINVRYRFSLERVPNLDLLHLGQLRGVVEFAGCKILLRRHAKHIVCELVAAVLVEGDRVPGVDGQLLNLITARCEGVIGSRDTARREGVIGSRATARCMHEGVIDSRDTARCMHEEVIGSRDTFSYHDVFQPSIKRAPGLDRERHTSNGRPSLRLNS